MNYDNLTTLTLDMTSFAEQVVEAYCELANYPKDKLRKVNTPCLPESLLKNDDLAHTGELSGVAARILLKALWLGRLAQPDLCFISGRLAAPRFQLVTLGRLTALEDDLLPALDLGILYVRLCCPRGSAAAAHLYRLRFWLLSTGGQVHERHCHVSCYWKAEIPCVVVLQTSIYRSTPRARSRGCCYGICHVR